MQTGCKNLSDLAGWAISVKCIAGCSEMEHVHAFCVPGKSSKSSSHDKHVQVEGSGCANGDLNVKTTCFRIYMLESYSTKQKLCQLWATRPNVIDFLLILI